MYLKGCTWNVKGCKKISNILSHPLLQACPWHNCEQKHP